MLSRFVLSLPIVFAFALVAQAGPRTGTVEYPAIDNLNLREGTIEMWLRLDFDVQPVEPKPEFRGMATLLTFNGDVGGFSMGLALTQNQPMPRWWTSIGPDVHFHGFSMEHGNFGRGEWHHYAIVWKELNMWSYIDGKPANGTTFLAPMDAGFGSQAGTVVRIGDKWNVYSRYAIDDLRISRVARRAEELGFHGELKPDPFAAVLDSFECDFTPDGTTTTTPRVIFRGAGGVPSAQCRFVEGKFGKALSMFDPAFVEEEKK